MSRGDMLICTLINLFMFGFAVYPLFEEMNLLRFLLIGFGVIVGISPLIACWDDNEDDR